MLVTYLKKIPLFKHLKDTQLREIASRCKSVTCRRGTTLFRRTDMSTDFYIVHSGRMKAILEDDEGDEIVLAQFEKGDFFGELSLLDGKGRSATIVADEDSDLSVLNKSVFFDLLMKDPKIAIGLMITLVERLRGADEMIESLAFREVGERLIRTLLESAEEAAGEDPRYLRTAKQTHRQLAARIGSSRESVSKCIKTLAAKKIVREGNGYLLIAREALEQLKAGDKHAETAGHGRRSL